MGRKIGFCVGQNIYAPSSGVTPLKGCVNDALLIGEMLRRAGFDVRQAHNEAATQAGILDRLEIEVAKLREGDYFVFWNSSHGYQVQDRSGDELVEGLDEAICSYDTDPRDPLTDDKFYQILGRANPRANIAFISDSCHSGTLTRDMLRAMSDDERTPRLWIPPDDVLFRVGTPLVVLENYVGEPEAAVKPPKPGARDDLRRFGRLGRPESEMHHLLLSGCQPDEVSWDAKFAQGYHGAMTYNFAKAVLSAWKDKSPITYREAHKAAIAGLKASDFDQTPQLEGSEELKAMSVFGYVP